MRKRTVLTALAIAVMMVITSVTVFAAHPVSDVVGEAGDNARHATVTKGGEPTDDFIKFGGDISNGKNGKAIEVNAKYATKLGVSDTGTILSGTDTKKNFKWKQPADEGGDTTHYPRRGTAYYVFNAEKSKNIKVRYPNVTYSTIGDNGAEVKTKIDVEATVTLMDVKKVEHYMNFTGIKTAYLSLSKKSIGGAVKVDMINLSEVHITYKYFKAGTNEPITISSNTTYGDIDWNQAMGFNYEKFGKVYVTSNSKLYFAKAGKYKTIYDAKGSVAKGEKDLPYATSFTFSSPYADIAYVANVEEKQATGKRSYYAPSNFPLILPKPVDSSGDKKMSDANESKVKTNTISTLSDTWTANCTQPVAKDHSSGGSPFEKLILEDTMEPVVDVKAAVENKTYKIYNNAGTDLTPYFDVTANGNTFVATAKADFLKSANADKLIYGSRKGDTIHMDVTVGFKKDVSYAGLMEKYKKTETTVYFPNTFKTTIRGNSPLTNVTRGTMMPVPSDPTKTMSDEDETKVETNTVPDRHKTWTANITQVIPSGYSAKTAPVSKFVMKDEMESVVDVKSAVEKKTVKIKDKNGTDVTDKFDYSQEGNTFVATAKKEYLSSDAFYNNTLTMEITVGFKSEEEVSDADLLKYMGEKETQLVFKNKATTVINDWSGNANANTILEIPTGKDGKAGLAVSKDANPYEYRVGDIIPYTVKVWQTNEKANATHVVLKDTDFPEGITIDKDSLKAESRVENPESNEAAKEEAKEEANTETNTENPETKEKAGKAENLSVKAVDGGFELTCDRLPYGETIVVTFNATADKSLNGQIVPNTAKATADLLADKDGKKWYDASTTVYINSPKMNVEKKITEKMAKVGEDIHYEAEITQTNKGCFARDVVFTDIAQVKGLTLNKESIAVKDASGKPLTQGEDYTVSYLTEEELKDGKFTAYNGESVEGYTGFSLQFKGKYANMGNENIDHVVADKETTNSSYSKGEYEQANANMTTKLVVTYSMKAGDELAGKDIKNYAESPNTKNTNGDLIPNDEDIPSGGDYSEAKTKGEPPQMTHEKAVKEKKTAKGDTLHYTLTTKGKIGIAENVVITDTVTSKNLKYDKKSVKVMKNKDDITKSCKITFGEYNFTIETKTNLTKADTITVTYSATATNDKKVDNVSTAKADNIDPIKAKQTVTPTPKKKSVIEKIASQTGDMNKVLPYLVIILVAGGSLVYYIRKRR